MAVVKKRYNFTYDLNSNILSNNNYTFIYNEANRLTQSTSIDGTTTYSYNGYEQRVRTETINGNDVKTTWFIYEGGKLVYEEFQENSKNPISTKYLYLNGNLVGVVKNDEIYQKYL